MNHLASTHFEDLNFQQRKMDTNDAKKQNTDTPIVCKICKQKFPAEDLRKFENSANLHKHLIRHLTPKVAENTIEGCLYKRVPVGAPPADSSIQQIPDVEVDEDAWWSGYLETLPPGERQTLKELIEDKKGSSPETEEEMKEGEKELGPWFPSAFEDDKDVLFQNKHHIEEGSSPETEEEMKEGEKELGPWFPSAFEDDKDVLFQNKHHIEEGSSPETE
eukprot:Platyproteum_vivax@DN4758_c0_g1_i1.p1